MNLPLLKIAIVGHTNTGKTSLVRTLLRTRDFGEVRDEGGTTRQVQGATLEIAGKPVIELYDSPGLEAAGALIEFLEALPGMRHDGPDRIRQMLASPEARREFAQEARVLELVLDCHVGLYVIDAREPVLAKYSDELDILGRCARPILAVLNFVASPASREAEWREALARVKLHTVLALDAVVRDPHTELQLFEKLKSQLDDFEPTLTAWMEQRRREEIQRRVAAARLIADLLIDAGAFCRLVRLDDEGARDAALEELKRELRRREQACVDALLDLYRFGSEDYDDAELPLADGRWGSDLFDPDALKHYGLSTGGYAGAGAGLGAAFDLATAGLTLGAGTVTGTLVGTGVGLARNLGQSAIARIRGFGSVHTDDATLRRLAWRQLELLRALIRRGHASQVPVAAAADSATDWKTGRLPRPLRKARLLPKLSHLNREFDAAGTRRQELQDELADVLLDELTIPPRP